MFDGSLTLGPLALPVRYLVAFVAVALAFAFVAWTMRGRPATRRRALDLAVNAGIVFLLGWKLSPLVLTPSAVFQDPITLLYAPGGPWGALLGAGLASLMVVLLLRRQGGSLAVLGLPVAILASLSLLLYGAASVGFSAADALSAGEGESGYDGSVRSLEVEALSGSPRSLAEIQERVPAGVTVLNFWATWCGPCRAENAVKREAHLRWQDRIAFVGVNLTRSESGAGAVRGYVEEEDLEYEILLDARGALQHAFGVRGTPSTVVLDGTGRVVARRFGPMTRQWINAAIRNALERSTGAEPTS